MNPAVQTNFNGSSAEDQDCGLPKVRTSQQREKCSSGDVSGTSSRRTSCENIAEHLKKFGETPATRTSAPVPKKKGLCSCFRGGSKTSSPEETYTPAPAPSTPFSTRNSQHGFAERDQTAIIFDWDDTLFPSTYVRNDLELSLRRHLKDQGLPPETKAEIGALLGQGAAAVAHLLRLASMHGRIILVTLARSPWVTNSCRFFYPGIGELLKELNVEIVYAQEGAQVDYNKVEMMSDEQTEVFWSEKKGRAIGAQLKSFYSQYEGQSWKNVISIGDSDFERLGTLKACQEYMKTAGIMAPNAQWEPARMRGLHSDPLVGIAFFPPVENTVNAHMMKMRTKTFKMVDQPTIHELLVEIELCRKWLPSMVSVDLGFDIDLSGVKDKAQVEVIEAQLIQRGPEAKTGTQAGGAVKS